MVVLARAHTEVHIPYSQGKALGTFDEGFSPSRQRAPDPDVAPPNPAYLRYAFRPKITLFPVCARPFEIRDGRVVGYEAVAATKAINEVVHICRQGGQA
jgi:hypothetical protein